MPSNQRIYCAFPAKEDYTFFLMIQIVFPHMKTSPNLSLAISGRNLDPIWKDASSRWMASHPKAGVSPDSFRPTLVGDGVRKKTNVGHRIGNIFAGFANGHVWYIFLTKRNLLEQNRTNIK